MKQSLVCAALGLTAFGASAQAIVANVVSATPIVQQVQVPRQACQQVMVQQPSTSGGGALLGAIVGGLVGSQIGGGSGRTAGLAVGAIGGAALGNSIESSNQQAQAVPQCTTEMTLENRTVGYDVTYEHEGRQYTVQMQQDPGPTVRLQMSPVGAQPAPSAPPQPYAGATGGPVVVAPPYGQGGVVVTNPPAPVVYSGYPQTVYGAPVYGQPVYGQPYGQPVYSQPVYPAPYYRPYPPVQLHLGIGYNYHRRHRH